MTIMVPNIGEDRLLGMALGKYSQEASATLKLFTNNITPAETDVAGTYTEAAGGGYAAITLNNADWTMVQGAPTSAEQPQKTFTFTGPLTGSATCYGYFVVGATTTNLLWSETFTAFQPTDNGDNIKITTKITSD